MDANINAVLLGKRLILIQEDAHFRNWEPKELDLSSFEDSGQRGTGDCKNDHGERTNYKLRDQAFYCRDRNGRMRKW